MNVRYSNVEGKLSDVVTFDELHQNQELCSTGSVAVIVEDANGDKFNLPYRPNVTVQPGMMVRPGVYPMGNVGELIFYPQENSEDYQNEVVDFSDTSSITEYISKQNQLKNIEKEILTTQDNIFRPPVGEDDTPEMKALKMAIAQKKIDIDKYASRFGENFPNDKRKMKDSKISLMLLKRVGEALDMNIQIRISDASPNVANPMGNPITVPITAAPGTGEDE